VLGLMKPVKLQFVVSFFWLVGWLVVVVVVVVVVVGGGG
jgi:hypothetical protein